MNNLEVLGALLIKSSQSNWPKPIRKVIKAASKEITDDLDDKQYALYIESGGLTITHKGGESG